ncbi:stage V sporulation protein AA [Halalkalibacter okhensis]|uniref:Stage V sporulation protein AA n=1 Tax=Halalkalibacter okhensis TaxID=333138 RepID=A0A0B0ICL4_9BACI|nr:stage V sporulation protein AA [Halalkalibacter okhensis]KHF37784.1 stage V sporulation protein AA [Halalkalibacter okhensis]
MVKDHTIYIRLHHRVKISPKKKVSLNDIAQCIFPAHVDQSLCEVPFYQVSEEDGRLVIIDILQVIRFIKKRHPDLEVSNLGENHTILEVSYPMKTPSVFLVGFVWMLLFFGSGLAIMHFHEDVNMLAAHQKIYTILTNHESEHPFILQIPYSIGLGLGMILFFNRVFKKKFNNEPSPLEVEMFNYQQNLDLFTILEERDGERK